MEPLIGQHHATRKTGAERFLNWSFDPDADLLGFWQWACSDLLSNTLRGILAEYVVAQALGVAKRGVRKEWDAYDLLLEDGTKVEVKSAAYVQSWKQEKDSIITFGVSKKRAWDAETGLMSDQVRRHADVYVLALLHHKDRSTINPLDLSQWEFYVVPTFTFDERERSQHSITLPSLRALIDPVGHDNLKDNVLAAAVAQRSRMALLQSPT